MLENKKKKGILIRSRQEFFEEDIDNIEIFTTSQVENTLIFLIAIPSKNFQLA
jgi:hypothetical protein